MANEPRPVFCVDCKHRYAKGDGRIEFNEESSICKHPLNVSPVTGNQMPEECRLMRSYGFACGPYGTLFEGKAKDAFEEVFREDGEIFRGLADK